MGKQIQLFLNGQPATAVNGQTIAAVLLVNDIRIFRHTRKTGTGRGIFCGMGICFDCLVTVGGVSGVRACVTPVNNGMSIVTTEMPETTETRPEVEL